MEIDKDTVLVDRLQFMKYCEGILLEMHEGKGVVVNEQQCSRAEEALEKGDVVILTVNDMPYSKIQKNEINEYQESELES